MHLSRIDLNLFVVFDAIFTEGGVTRASERLNLTQPAISHALARLRELFDDPLFVRQGRAMVPTPLARNTIDRVRRSLRGLEITLNEVGRFDQAATQKRFALGLRDVLEPTLLPSLMRQVTATAPYIDIATVRADRRSLESELSAGTLDAAIDILLPLSENVRHARVATDRMVVVVRRDHPEVADGLNLATYLTQEHILVSSRRRGPGLVDVELSRQDLQRHVRLRCQDYFAACRIVSQTNLILTMPERDARVTNKQFDNRVLPLPLDGPPMDVYLYWHANADSDAANRWLRNEVIRAFEAGTPAPTET